MPVTEPIRPKIDNLPKYKPRDHFDDKREPTKRPRLDSDQPSTKMIDTTGAEAKKVTNHSQLEYESDYERNEASTKAESEDLNPLIDEEKPELNELDKKWLWWHLFAPSYSELTILFCGRATIDKCGNVRHDPQCSVPDSSFKFQIECDCTWIDERYGFDTESVTPLQQIKLSLEETKKE